MKAHLVSWYKSNHLHLGPAKSTCIKIGTSNYCCSSHCLYCTVCLCLHIGTSYSRNPLCISRDRNSWGLASCTYVLRLDSQAPPRHIFPRSKSYSRASSSSSISSLRTTASLTCSSKMLSSTPVLVPMEGTTSAEEPRRRPVVRIGSSSYGWTTRRDAMMPWSRRRWCTQISKFELPRPDLSHVFDRRRRSYLP